MQPALAKTLALWRAHPQIVNVRLVRLTDAWCLRVVFDDVQHTWNHITHGFGDLEYQTLVVLTRLNTRSRDWLRVECVYVSLYDQRVIDSMRFEPQVTEQTADQVSFIASY